MDYPVLLDAAISHLEELKDQGVRFVDVKPETMTSLDKAPVRHRPAPANSRPAPVDIPRSEVRANETAAEISIPSPVTNKEQAMAELRERALQCVKCEHLVQSRKNVVFGVGTVHAELMFVGEAPGMDEDAQGEPFVGKAGQLLTKIIETMGLSREKVYIANILKCRPDTPEQQSGNRKPTPVEMTTCLPYVAAQVGIIQPKVIVCLGATAVEGLFGRDKVGITRQRGNWMSYRDIPVMPTFHPSYLLHREGALQEKRKVWEDMLAVMERLGMAISDKHRGYFLKK